MRLWDDNIKMDIKETSFVFRLNYSLQQGTKRIFFFGKGNEVILQKKLNNFKYFAIESF